MKEERTDQLLWEGIKAGDEHALELLFKSYYASFCRSALRIVKEEAVAEELVSDVFYSIWSKRDSLDIRSNIRGYLSFSVRNHALNYLKSKKLGYVDLDEVSHQLEVSEDNPEHLLITEETLNAWERRISELPPQRQKVFRMNKLEGLTYKEIAERLSLSEKTVRNQVQIAVRTLGIPAIALWLLILAR
jgi:RNA polymerase sigma-70 factor (ECF subfamily)